MESRLTCGLLHSAKIKSKAPFCALKLVLQDTRYCTLNLVHDTRFCWDTFSVCLKPPNPNKIPSKLNNLRGSALGKWPPKYQSSAPASNAWKQDSSALCRVAHWSLLFTTLISLGHSTLATRKWHFKAKIHFPSKIYKSALSCCRLLSSRHFTSSATLSSRSSNWTVNERLGEQGERRHVPMATSHLISRIRKLGLSPEPR